MERETKIIEIGAYKFEVKTYASAREANEIQGAYLKGSEIEMVGDQPTMKKINPNIQFEVEKEMIKQLVIAFDTNKENLVDRIIDLPNESYLSLIKELDSLISKKKTQKPA